MFPIMAIDSNGDSKLVPGIVYLVNSPNGGIHEKWLSIETIGDHYSDLLVNIHTGKVAHWSKLDIIRQFIIED